MDQDAYDYFFDLITEDFWTEDELATIDRVSNGWEV